MAQDKKHLSDFVKNIFEDNFAEAKNDLQSAITEKLKSRMKDQMQESSSAISNKGE